MSAANGGVDQCRSVVHFQPDARSLLYVDDLFAIFVLSGSSAEPDNTNGSKSNHQHKEVSGVRLKCAT